MKSKEIKSISHGSTVIEFALVAFIFFLVLWGLIEFGRAFYQRNTAQYLTRCMAREAVVLKPSQYDLAKQSCLLNANGMFTWPFYSTPSDLRNKFAIRYFLRNGNYIDEPNNSLYDNQVEACLTADARCVIYVQARAVPGSMVDMGILRSWLQVSGTIAERFAATTLPPESMGYSP